LIRSSGYCDRCASAQGRLQAIGEFICQRLVQDRDHPQDVIPDCLVNVTFSFVIAVDLQSSSTADKDGYSIPALDNRYDLSVTL
jgi:hypothetical protein